MMKSFQILDVEIKAKNKLSKKTNNSKKKSSNTSMYIVYITS